MEEFVKGDVVVLPFPFSNLSRSKKRPALVVANLQGDDLILNVFDSINYLQKSSDLQNCFKTTN